jgi:hypothetical protein
LQGVFGPEAIADVGLAALEDGMGGDEILVDATGLDDVVGDGVEDVKVGLRREHHADVCEVERAVLEGREHGDADMRWNLGCRRLDLDQRVRLPARCRC